MQNQNHMSALMLYHQHRLSLDQLGRGLLTRTDKMNCHKSSWSSEYFASLINWYLVFEVNDQATDVLYLPQQRERSPRLMLTFLFDPVSYDIKLIICETQK